MRAIIISADGFEDEELLKPRDALRADGFAVELATPGGTAIHGKRGAEVAADRDIEQVDPERYDLLVLPGGKAPDKLRTNPKVQTIAKAFFAAQKPVAAICHGPQILISAGLLRGRKATAYRSVAPELREAGADYRDEAVVVDGNLITSRQPSDIPDFMAAIEQALHVHA